MKKLLLSCLMLGLGASAFAQGTCAAATNITVTSGTFTTGAINGTYLSPCLGGTTNDAGAAMKARWWKYTPTANGEITVSSDIAANPAAADTRVSILKGTCGAQTCVDDSDDVSATNYRTTLTVPVAAGTTYYIEWDNYWEATSFQFQFTFVATPCVRVGANDFYLPDFYTTTSASLFFNNAIGSPTSYDIDWSTTFATAAGAGTIVNVPAGATTYTQGDLTGLPESLNFRYYVRSNCGATQSAWQGPNYGFLAVPLPYSNDFEIADNNYTDGFIGFTRFNSTATSTPPNYDGNGGIGNAMFTFNSQTAASNRRAYSRAITLVAGEEVTVAFKTRLYPATGGSAMSMDLTVGTGQSAADQTEIVGTVAVTDGSAYADNSFTWTAPSDGVYFFGFHNNSALGAVSSAIFLDNLDISSVLSTNEVISSKLSVFPNPANNVVNISNTVNATINTVEMTDLNGRIVKSVKVNATEGQISIGDLATGMYMMKISTDQGVATKKIVKQ